MSYIKLWFTGTLLHFFLKGFCSGCRQLYSSILWYYCRSVQESIFVIFFKRALCQITVIISKLLLDLNCETKAKTRAIRILYWNFISIIDSCQWMWYWIMIQMNNLQLCHNFTARCRYNITNTAVLLFSSIDIAMGLWKSFDSKSKHKISIITILNKNTLD